MHPHTRSALSSSLLHRNARSYALCVVGAVRYVVNVVCIACFSVADADKQAINDEIERETKRRQAKFEAFDESRKQLSQRWPVRGVPMALGSGNQEAANNVDRLDAHLKQLEARQMQLHQQLSLADEKKLIQDIAAARALRTQLKEHYQQLREHAADRTLSALHGRLVRLDERQQKDVGQAAEFRQQQQAAEHALQGPLHEQQQTLQGKRSELQQRQQQLHRELDAVRAKIDTQKAAWVLRRDAQRQEALERQRAKQDARLKRDADRLNAEARHAPLHKQLACCSQLLLKLQATLAARRSTRRPAAAQSAASSSGKAAGKSGEPPVVAAIDLELLVQFESLSLLPPSSLGVSEIRAALHQLRLKKKWLHSIQRQLLPSDHPDYPSEAADAALDEQAAAEEAAELAAAAAVTEEPERASELPPAARNKVVEISEDELLLIIQRHEREALLAAVTRQSVPSEQDVGDGSAQRQQRRSQNKARTAVSPEQQPELVESHEHSPADDDVADVASAADFVPVLSSETGVVLPASAADSPMTVLPAKKTPLPPAVLEKIRQLTLDGASFEEISAVLEAHRNGRNQEPST
eukprot:TRINITY_DN1829_c0_g1_i3.p1 TRINITY_DN1829_c0_g1~~TRINITY_DN1829_c0_g1_i3.p1  ORF type:complete len:582 (+),score=173.35 TRINITY_DN1829_c0_g1_i3:1193-2938(+)